MSDRHRCPTCNQTCRDRIPRSPRTPKPRIDPTYGVPPAPGRPAITWEPIKKILQRYSQRVRPLTVLEMQYLLERETGLIWSTIKIRAALNNARISGKPGLYTVDLDRRRGAWYWENQGSSKEREQETRVSVEQK